MTINGRDASDEESPAQESWTSASHNIHNQQHQHSRGYHDHTNSFNPRHHRGDRDARSAVTTPTAEGGGGGIGERRASCDFCSRRKRKCDGQQPCQNCRKLALECHFSVKQKSGRKRKPRSGEEGAAFSDQVASPSPRGVGAGAARIDPSSAAAASGAAAAKALAAAAASVWANEGDSDGSDDGSGPDGGGDATDGSYGYGGGSSSGDVRASCDSCNRKKQRCNGERPCSGCLKIGQQNRGVYSTKRKATKLVGGPFIGRQKPRRDKAIARTMSSEYTGSGVRADFRVSHESGGRSGSLSPSSSANGGFSRGGSRTSRHSGTFAPSPHNTGPETLAETTAAAMVAGAQAAAAAAASGSVPARYSPPAGSGAQQRLSSMSGLGSTAAAAAASRLLSPPASSVLPPESAKSPSPAAFAFPPTAAAAMKMSKHAPVPGPSGFLSAPHMLSGAPIREDNMEEAEAAEARAMELKAKSVEAKERSEVAAAEAAAAAAAAEVAKEAATAVVSPLPATREEPTKDGRVGRRENAFLDTYFAFFGRFARLESESEARRTLIELSLQAASPAADQTDERFGANSGAATRISGGVGSAAERHGPVGLPLTASGLTRGVSPEKGASLWAGVGIGAMLQGARPDDGKRYAIMAKKQLAGAQSRGATPRDPQPFSAAAAAGGAGPPVDIRVQERVRAILMLTVLYDMLGQYDESDKYLADALNCVADASTHLRDVIDLLTAAKTERALGLNFSPPSKQHNHGGEAASGSATRSSSSNRQSTSGHTAPSRSKKTRGGRGGGVESVVGMGETKQPTPMLITEGNALSLLNRLSWDTLRRFTKLPFAAASRGGQGGSSCQALAEWRNAEGWYSTLTKAHSHLCADLNDDVRALPRCPLAVGLLKSKLSWLHSCLGRTTAAADKSQVMLALLEPFPGAGRWSLWRHPLHLAACHLAIAGRPGAYEKLRRTLNAFRLPGQEEHPPYHYFHRLSEQCPACSPTVSLLVKAYKPHLTPLLGTPGARKSGGSSSGADAAGSAAVSGTGNGQGSGDPLFDFFDAGMDVAAPAPPQPSLGYFAAPYPSAGAAAAAQAAAAQAAALAAAEAATASAAIGAAAGVAGVGSAVVGDGLLAAAIDAVLGDGGGGVGGGEGGAGVRMKGIAGAVNRDSWKSEEGDDSHGTVGMFGPGTRVIDRHPSVHDYQILVEMFAGDQQVNASLATPLDPFDDLIADWTTTSGEAGSSMTSAVLGHDTNEGDNEQAESPVVEHTLFSHPNPNANFGPQFTPADDPAPADSTADSASHPGPPATANVAATVAAAMFKLEATGRGFRQEAIAEVG